jgi:hypothetical protein
MFKRALAVLAAFVLGLGIALAAAAAPAAAHLPIVNITCDSVMFGFAGYTGSTNTFTLYVDGQVATEVTFDESLDTSTPVRFDPTVSHDVWWQLDATEDSYDVTAPPVITSPCVIETSCAHVSVLSGRQLSPGLSLAVGLRGPGGVREARAEIVQGVPGGYNATGSADGLGVQYTDWNNTLTMRPLSEAEVLSGELDLLYGDLSGGLPAYSVEWVTFNGQDVTPGQVDCGYQTLAISPVPSFTPPTCLAGGTLVLPLIGGITWTGGRSGDGPGAYLVTAVPDFGTVIDGPTTFSLTVPGPDRTLCNIPTLALVTPVATMKQETCSGGGGSYSLSDDGPAIQWLVNGVAVNPGTYRATAGVTVEVRATLTDPVRHGFNNPNDPTSWTFAFESSRTSCDLITLALTGSSAPVGLGIGLALLLGAAGVLGVYLGRRQRVDA